eukprot:1035937-Rhodomonas_salina.1
MDLFIVVSNRARSAVWLPCRAGEGVTSAVDTSRLALTQCGGRVLEAGLDWIGVAGRCVERVGEEAQAATASLLTPLHPFQSQLSTSCLPPPYLGTTCRWLSFSPACRARLQRPFYTASFVPSVCLTARALTVLTHRP